MKCWRGVGVSASPESLGYENGRKVPGIQQRVDVCIVFVSSESLQSEFFRDIAKWLYTQPSPVTS